MTALLDIVFGSTDSDAYYAREADRMERGMHQYGGNASLVTLRCFKYYHADQGSFLEDLEGRQRWLGPKASRIWAIAHRDAGTQTTMKAIAAEAMCCVSTVSRALTRLQAFGLLAVDVKRGRNGGITVRLARIARQFRSHIDAAWRRIRSWLNVASRSSVTEEGTQRTRTPKDATFIGVVSHEQCRRFGLLDCESFDHTPLPASAASRAADQEQARAAEFARAFFHERALLDAEDPDWDIYLEKVRSSYGMS